MTYTRPHCTENDKSSQRSETTRPATFDHVSRLRILAWRAAGDLGLICYLLALNFAFQAASFRTRCDDH